ncbi:MAG: DUF1887 family protein [Chloroflexi bacterium]|nr:DUF1887 family protein [Chloroflexota bacterium]
MSERDHRDEGRPEQRHMGHGEPHARQHPGAHSRPRAEGKPWGGNGSTGRLVPRRRPAEPPTSAPPIPFDGRPILVTLVGDEPLAPLVLAQHLNAGRVICIGLPVVEWRVEPLLEILRQHGCSPAWIPLSILDVPAGVDEIEQRLGFQNGDPVIFDLTNARGVLGFALYELAHRRESVAPERNRLVRVDWSDRTLRAISPDDTAAEPLRANVGLADYLGVHGKALLGRERTPGSPSPFGEAARRLARSIPQARPLIEATHRGGADRPLRIHHRRASAHLIDGLTWDGVLEQRGDAVYATSMRAFQFLHGRWLEEYLFEIADASGQFDDCASGVRFRWTFAGEERPAGQLDVDNEIDFAGTAAGRATIASCKTGGHDVNGPLYELLTLAERAAGRSVVTVFATTDTLDRAARHRAAALGVRVADATRLPNPDTVLELLLNGVSATRSAADEHQDAPGPHAARAPRHRRRDAHQEAPRA